MKLIIILLLIAMLTADYAVQIMKECCGALLHSPFSTLADSILASLVWKTDYG